MTRKRTTETQNKDHENYIAEKGFNPMSPYNLVHKPIPILQAMKISDAKAAVDKVGQAEKTPARQESKS